MLDAKRNARTRKVTLLPAATKLGQGNIFTSVCQEFCPRGGGGLPQCMLGYTIHPPPGPARQTPPDQADPPGTRQTPPGAGDPPPRTRQTPPDQADPPTPLGAGDSPRDQADPPRSRRPPGAGNPPPREADCSIRSTSGRYASYWNAFLFVLNLFYIPLCVVHIVSLYCRVRYYIYHNKVSS